MIEKLQKLEQEALKLEPSMVSAREMTEKVSEYGLSFIEKLDHLKAYVLTKSRGEAIQGFDVGNGKAELADLLNALDEHVAKVGLNPASGGHLGYIPGGGIFPAALGDYLADVLNSYAGVFFGSPGAVRLENMLIRWMCKIIGFPNSALGNLTSGGSMANLIAMTTARDKKLKHSDEFKDAVIYLTEQVHHSVTKAIRIAGFGYAHIRHIAVDANFRMDMDALNSMVQKDAADGLNPFLVIASAGTTDTGAVDPLDRIADVCTKHDMWFHIDAAYGGFFVLTEEVKHKFVGIEQADSVTIDPHKGLFLPYGLGAILVKDVEALKHAHHYQANYMRDAVGTEDEPSPADLSPELTKPFRGLRMWLPLKLFGIKPFKAAIEEKIWLCRYFYEEVQKIEDIEVGPYPELSVATWRLTRAGADNDELNRKLAIAIQQDGRVFMSSTTLNGKVWMRIAVLSFRTHKSTIDLALKMIKELIVNL